DLIVTDPRGAEMTTVRLAKVLRHVLARSSQPLTSVQDELEFIRTYLSIEEARFLDRLHIQIDVAAVVAVGQIPSLILQPLVENALKHGLAPKPGPVHLWISARAEGNHICLSVEDDGMGAGVSTQGSGVGLANTLQRLKTLYKDGASLRFEPRETGGS